MKRSVIFFDEHGVFVDKPLKKLRMQFLKDLKLTEHDELILGGDNIDFYCMSNFIKSDDRLTDAMTEIDDMNISLSDYRKAIGKANLVWIFGNHEARYARQLLRPELQAFRKIKGLQLEEVFAIKENNVEVCDLHYMINDHLMVTHGEACNTIPARSELLKYLKSGISGHVHRRDFAHKIGIDKPIEWHCSGHLSNKKYLDESCKYSKTMLWEQGFMFVISDKEDFDIESIKIRSGCFYSKYLRKSYENKVITGKK